MKCKPIEEIKAFLEPFAEEQGIEIYDVEFKAGKEPALTVYIDKEGGVDLDTCATPFTTQPSMSAIGTQSLLNILPKNVLKGSTTILPYPMP